MMIGLKRIPNDIPEGLRDYALSTQRLKERYEELQTVLILSGGLKNDIDRSVAEKIIRGGPFDKVLYKEDFDSISRGK